MTRIVVWKYKIGLVEPVDWQTAITRKTGTHRKEYVLHEHNIIDLYTKTENRSLVVHQHQYRL